MNRREMTYSVRHYVEQSFWFQQNNISTKIIRVVNEQNNTALVDVIKQSGCRFSRSTVVIKLLNENLCEVAEFN